VFRVIVQLDAKLILTIMLVVYIGDRCEIVLDFISIRVIQTLTTTITRLSMINFDNAPTNKITGE